MKIGVAIVYILIAVIYNMPVAYVFLHQSRFRAHNLAHLLYLRGIHCGYSALLSLLKTFEKQLNFYHCNAG